MAHVYASKQRGAYRDVRDFVSKEGLSKQEALHNGMEVKSVEFVQQGAEVYHKA